MGDETDTTSKNVAKLLLKGSHIIYRIVIANAAYPDRVITDNAAYTSRVSTDINAASGTGNAPIFGATEIYDEDDTQVVRVRFFLLQILIVMLIKRSF